MSYNTELSEKSSVEKDLLISIDRSAFEKNYETELGKIASQAQLKGFRPGRAPKAMVDKTHGPRIYDEVLNRFIGTAIQETIDKEKLSVVDTTFSDLDRGEGDGPVKVRVVLSLLPDPQFKDFNDLTVEYTEQALTPELLEERLTRTQEMFSEVVETQRTTVQEGDVVTLSFKELSGSDDKAGMSGEDQSIELGKGQLPEEIEKALIGATIGVPCSISYAFPDTAAEELKGKVSEFEFTISEIKERKSPDLDDEFAKKTGIAESLDELKVFFEKQIASQIENANKESKDAALIDLIVSKNDFELPQVLIDREIRVLLSEMRMLDPNDKNFHSAPVEQYRPLLSERAGARVKRYIAIEKLLEQGGYEASEAEVETLLDELAAENESSRDQVNAQYRYPQQMEGLKRMAAVKKMFNSIGQTTSFVAKSSTEEVGK